MRIRCSICGRDIKEATHHVVSMKKKTMSSSFDQKSGNTRKRVRVENDIIPITVCEGCHLGVCLKLMEMRESSFNSATKKDMQ